MLSVAEWHKAHGAGRLRMVKEEWIATAVWLSRTCQTITSAIDLFVLVFAVLALMLLLCLEIEHEP